MQAIEIRETKKGISLDPVSIVRDPLNSKLRVLNSIKYIRKLKSKYWSKQKKERGLDPSLKYHPIFKSQKQAGWSISDTNFYSDVH